MTHLDTRVDQETLEPLDARLEHTAQLALVARHYTSPKAHIAVDAHTLCLFALDPQRIDRRRGRYRVERHIDQRGHSPAQCRHCPRLEALPCRSPRLIQVYMAADSQRESTLADEPTYSIKPGKST